MSYTQISLWIENGHYIFIENKLRQHYLIFLSNLISFVKGCFAVLKTYLLLFISNFYSALYCWVEVNCNCSWKLLLRRYNLFSLEWFVQVSDWTLPPPPSLIWIAASLLSFSSLSVATLLQHQSCSGRLTELKDPRWFTLKYSEKFFQRKLNKVFCGFFCVKPILQFYIISR